jgi:arylsulfatase A-like enzyme
MLGSMGGLEPPVRVQANMAVRYGKRVIWSGLQRTWWFAILLMCIGCHRPPVDAPFHRFVEEVIPEQRWHEVKVRIGHETRNVLSAPYRSALQEIEVAPDGTITLGEVAELERVSGDSEGLRMKVQRPPFWGRHAAGTTPTRVYVPVPPEQDAAALAFTKVQVLPAGKEKRKVRILAREVVDLPQEHITKQVRVPESARLDFGIGLEGDTSGTPLCDARFTIAVERGPQREKIFSRTLEREPGTDGPGWVDATVDLSGLAGSRVRFVFRTERASGEEEETKGNSVSLFDWSPVWSSPILYSAQSERTVRKPNIILISLDTLRADHLGCHGYNRDTSPNIDDFSLGAVLFENCIASSSWTLPSHASVFTGLHPSVHGAEVHPWGPPFADSETTLAELARERGYLTAAYTEGLFVSASLGFAQGFELYSDGKLAEFPLHCAEVTFNDALQWLKTYGKLPFLLFVHTYQPHDPYTPPRRFGEMFVKDYAQSGRVRPREVRSEEDKIRCEALYDGEIAYTDEVLGDFLERLEETQLLQNTTIVVFSDHGEEFWEHGGIEHGVTLYDEVLHVPLIVKLAGENPPSGRVARQVSLTDLYATVAELLGADDANPPDCESLLPLMRPERRAEYGRKFVVSQVCHRDTVLQSMMPEWRRRSIRTDTEKYIKFEKEQTEELYDLAGDPGEKNDVSAENEQDMVQYRAMLDSFLETVFAGRAAVSAEERVAPLTEERRRQLKALGYM